MLRYLTSIAVRTNFVELYNILVIENYFCWLSEFIFFQESIFKYK